MDEVCEVFLAVLFELSSNRHRVFLGGMLHSMFESIALPAIGKSFQDDDCMHHRRIFLAIATPSLCDSPPLLLD